ncbi:MAG: RDD family protein [bacterium]|nr:RDD family protein [bacterium]
MLRECPLCQRERKATTFKPLYGQDVCKKCYYAFANRRQLAFVIDVFLIRVLSFAVPTLIFSVVTVDQSNIDFYEGVITLLVLGITYVLILLKDGMGGASPGKMVTGVQVIDETSRAAGNWLQSLKRNLPVLIPIVPLIIAVQLQKGHRWGDGWSNTKVIWKKYRDHPVFTGEPLGVPEGIGDDYQRPGDLAGGDNSNPFAPPVR